MNMMLVCWIFAVLGIVGCTVYNVIIGREIDKITKKVIKNRMYIGYLQRKIKKLEERIRRETACF